MNNQPYFVNKQKIFSVENKSFGLNRNKWLSKFFIFMQPDVIQQPKLFVKIVSKQRIKAKLFQRIKFTLISSAFSFNKFTISIRFAFFNCGLIASTPIV